MAQEKLNRNNIVAVCKSECSKYGLSSNYSSMLVSGSRSLVKFMQEKQIVVYSPNVGSAFREYVHTIKTKKYADEICRSVDLLNSYIQSETFVFQKPRLARTFPGEFGPLVKKYIRFLRDEMHCQPTTLNTYEYILNKFCVKADVSEVTVKSIKLEDLLDFFSSVQNMKREVVRCVKGFMRYLKEFKIVEQDLCLDYIRPCKYSKEKLPSYYSKEEILQFENQIDRLSIVGKRDYAMFLLASRLGLRSSDIRLLQFSDIDWDKNEIRIIQKKTKKSVILPLLEDVGTAIIDYVMNARPDTKDKSIFVSFRAPYHVITAATFSGMVAKYIHRSDIDWGGKHHGSHSLRHSLATNLLGGNVSLPVISSILGHSSTNTTKSYLAIDVQSLMYCSHEVPDVDVDFYEQEGGDFYV